MSPSPKLREPKTPRLFRLLSPKAAQEIADRRFFGLRDRRGIDPPGDVSLDSVVTYYTNRENRETHSVGISELETKSATDDWPLKIFGIVLFAITFFLSILCVWFDEARAVLFPAAIAYRPGNIVSGAMAVVLLYVVFFAWMYNKFMKMDKNWENNIDSFFTNGARPQMEAVRDAMREFKRFVKWRRFMRLTMWVAAIVIAMEIILLSLSDGIGQLAGIPLRWSHAEVLFAAGFLSVQFVWFAFYWWIWVYATMYRDPTLQICVMINATDRASVATANVADRDRR